MLKINNFIFCFSGNIKHHFKKKMLSKRFYKRLRGIFLESFDKMKITIFIYKKDNIYYNINNRRKNIKNCWKQQAV